MPTAKDQDGNITVTYKPFGVGLAFTPVVLSEGRISLKISTEVSELTTQGQVSQNGLLTLAWAIFGVHLHARAQRPVTESDAFTSAWMPLRLDALNPLTATTRTRS